MSVAEQSVGTARESVVTPIKVVLVGAVLALLEGIYDIDSADLYTGVFGGVEVTTFDVVLVTAVAMAIALVMIGYAYTVRYTSTKRAYLVLGVLSIGVLVVGVLFTAGIALLGAVLGYWETRHAPAA